MDLVVKLLAGAGLAIPAGLNPFIPLLVLSIAGMGGKIILYSPFDVLGSWPVIGVLAVLVGVDIFVDKLPQFEKLYANVNYVLRPLAGALAFAAVVPPDQFPTGLSFLLGLILAGVTFWVKLNLRPAILTRSKAGVVLQPLISVAEDGIASFLAIFSVLLPVVGGPLSILVLLSMVWWWSSLRRSVPAIADPK